ncbi:MULTISPECIES: hypothetical protein [unclassified Amycolatopsis]|uniref:hypothetical protein n=1 Tax=unclassified Amycolatopsis TaxID=2618356 RepID=UPI00287B8410|nr:MULTISPECIES: hypothetical protein [unclassified Amycolatopsis]
MASPDTDELATVPLPAGEPDAEQVAAREAAEPTPARGTAAVPRDGAEPAGPAAARGAAAVPPVGGRAVADAPTVPGPVPSMRAEPAEPVPAHGAAAVPLEPAGPAAVRGAAAVPPVGGRAVADAPTEPQERVEPERVEPVEPSPEADERAPAKAAKDRGRWWRGFTGSLAAGLAVLAAGVLAVGIICLFTGAPGPGATLLIGHPIAAVLALLAQRVADRRNGPPAVGAGLAVVLFTVSAITMFWLA